MNINFVASWSFLLPVLVGLALIDSRSFGTLAISVWLLMAPGRVRVARVLTYLVTIGGFYYGIGVVLPSGAQGLMVQVQVDWNHPAMRTLGGLVGLGS